MATSTLKKITPANIGAVNKAGDTMTGPLTMDSNLFGALGNTGFRSNVGDGALSYLSTSDDFYGSGNDWNHFIICNHGNGETYYNYVLRLPFGDSPKYKRQMGGTSAQTPWYDFLTSEKTVTVEQGGTGGTTKPSAREGIGIRYTNIAIPTSPTVTSIGSNYQIVNVFPFSPDPGITFSALLINGLWQIYCNKPGNGLVANILYFDI